ncbi:hypothetical protein QQ056_03645 [Oscillatoria laete-virens NRMC-F 0139]|nr:hypothetical protein [Oscillatoria laete-virens]MDL5052655.1 hypothetical protein [Oscillatoria laete-virens NRMC-F 0139]
MMKPQEPNPTEPTNSATEKPTPASTSGSTQSPQATEPKGENLKALNTSPTTQGLEEPQGGDRTNRDSSAISEQPTGNNSSPNPGGCGDAERVSEYSDSPDENIRCLPDEETIRLPGRSDMAQVNDERVKNLNRVYEWLADIYHQREQLSFRDISRAYDSIKKAVNLIDELFQKIEELELKVKRIQTEKKTTEQNWGWFRQNTEAPLKKQIQDLEAQLKQERSNYQSQVSKIEYERQVADRRREELEESQARVMAQLASLKRNTGTHYDGTSDRPQHHVLTGEYKTLKEQHLDPLANSLFTFMAEIDPELKQQRKEKVNNIKAAISATVLIGGQAIMRGESTASVELPPGMLDDLLAVLCQRLQLNNQTLSSQITELLKKATNLAQGYVQYPAPAQWKEQDFQYACAELSDRLDRELKLGIASLSQELQTEVQNAVQNALLFLQRAAIAEPPASLSLDNEGDSFRSDYHEAAKGWDDEGTVIKRFILSISSMEKQKLRQSF